MRLKKGDKLYYKYQDGRDGLKDVAFEVIYLRDKPDDICIKWVDGTDWWWGQIGASEPWTIMFISEVDYLRGKKLDVLLNETRFEDR